jgi:hypothetical protein
MAYTFDKKNADAPSTHKTQYFEMMAIARCTRMLDRQHHGEGLPGDVLDGGKLNPGRLSLGARLSEGQQHAERVRE